jgi:glutamate/tyrosine decarboxylase-like PLP-dependent enzyme
MSTTLESLLQLLSATQRFDAESKSTHNNELIRTAAAILKEAQIHQSSTWAAHMTGVSSNTSLLGGLIANLHQGNLLSAELYPLLAKIEQQLIQLFCSEFSFALGHLTHGSTYANLEALWAARQRSAPRNKVYASKAAHYSINKACQLLQLELVYIDSTEDGRINSHALAQACATDAPAAIVLNAGTTTLGNIDPLSECMTVAQQYHAWLHIDAAWGGPFLLTENFADLRTVAAQADSLCFDAHKALNQPRSAGFLLYQQRLPEFGFEANYLQQPTERLPGSYGGETFLPLWFEMTEKGLDGINTELKQRLELAAQLATELNNITDRAVFLGDTAIVGIEARPGDDISELLAAGVLSTAMHGYQAIYRLVINHPSVSVADIIERLTPQLV